MQRALFAALTALAMPGLAHAGSLNLATVLKPRLQVVAPIAVDPLPPLVVNSNPPIGTVTAIPIAGSIETPTFTVVEGPSLSGTVSSGTVGGGSIGSGSISSGSISAGSTFSSSLTMSAFHAVAPVQAGSISVAYGSIDASAGAIIHSGLSSHVSAVETTREALVLTAAPMPPIAASGSLVLAAEVPLGDSAPYFAGALLPLIARLLGKRKAALR
jgi:hypothetical protein